MGGKTGSRTGSKTLETPEPPQPAGNSLQTDILWSVPVATAFRAPLCLLFPAAQVKL